MRFTVATIGTLGDVQPYIALGQGLKQAGHAVRIAADPIFQDMVCNGGLEFAPINVSPLAALQEDVQRIGSNPWRMVNWINRHLKPLTRQHLVEMREACRGADGLLFSALAVAAVHVAEALKMPSFATYLQPVSPTRAFPVPSAAPLPEWAPFRGTYNWLSFKLSNLLFFSMMKGTLDECRRDILSLPPVPWRTYASLDTSPIPIVYGFSKYVLPKPADWGDWLHVVGYWLLEAAKDWQPPSELAAFLSAGPPPMYVGFGSMIDEEAKAVTRLVVDALEQAGQRGILLGGWSNLGAGGLPRGVFRVNAVPHDWLFQRVAAAVHHGGAGTTAAGLRAGIPNVIVPFFGDQAFWGSVVHDLGVGPRPIPRKALTAARLAKAIEEATCNDSMRRQAAELGKQISAEDGVANGVSVIERLFGA